MGELTTMLTTHSESDGQAGGFPILVGGQGQSNSHVSLHAEICGMRVWRGPWCHVRRCAAAGRLESVEPYERPYNRGSHETRRTADDPRARRPRPFHSRSRSGRRATSFSYARTSWRAHGSRVTAHGLTRERTAAGARGPGRLAPGAGRGGRDETLIAQMSQKERTGTRLSALSTLNSHR